MVYESLTAIGGFLFCAALVHVKLEIKFVCLFFWQFFFVVVIVWGVLLFCFYILAGMWNSSLMRDQTLASAVKVPNPNH